MPTDLVSEAQTRLNLIDPQLKKAGWNLSDRSQIGLEIPVSCYDALWEEGDTDCCLYLFNSLMQKAFRGELVG